MYLLISHGNHYHHYDRHHMMITMADMMIIVMGVVEPHLRAV